MLKKTTKKKITKPRVKHVEFASQALRTIHDDWLLMVWCPSNRQAVYFLAEPEYGSGADKKKVTGYHVSALERSGEQSTLTSQLPRLFKTTDDAVDWLETVVDAYHGDAPIAKPA